MVVIADDSYGGLVDQPKMPKTWSIIPLPVRASVAKPMASPSIAARPLSFSLKILVESGVNLSVASGMGQDAIIQC